MKTKYRIRQTGPTTWALHSGDSEPIVYTDRDRAVSGYQLALATLSVLLRASLTAAAGDGSEGGSADGLLPETWVSDKGIAFSEDLAGGRCFSMTEWSWRDPTAVLVPLMLQTETAGGHFGAELAGFLETIENNDGTIAASGRFFDTDCGVQARDMLLNGLPFGVSVDPGEATQVEEEFTCTEFDDDGYCVAGDYKLNFLAYEIIGLTMTMFQGFPNAAIKLGAPAKAEAAVVVLSASGGNAAPPENVDVPARPPRARMLLAEPRLGEAFLDGLGDEYLIDQGDGSLAVPLTIDPPFVYGHAAYWGACHTGNPWGENVCASPDPSMSGYAHFHTGHMLCDDGSDVPTGVLTVGPEHAPESASPWGAQDFYASVANGWADVHAIDGEFGIWLSGVLRPDLTEMDLRVLRALSLSGDWRAIGGHLEMVGILAVNGPGLPIKRELLTASSWKIAQPALRASSVNGEQRMLIAAGMVARCPDCQKRRAEAAAGTESLAVAGQKIDRMLQVVETLERRTRHLEADAAAALRAQYGIIRA